MILAFAFAAAVLFGCGAYMLLKRDLVRVVAGIMLISQSAMVTIIGSSQSRGRAPIGFSRATWSATPCRQALALTALVIGLATVALLLALVHRVIVVFRTAEVDELAAGEAEHEAALEAQRAGRSGGSVVIFTMALLLPWVDRCRARGAGRAPPRRRLARGGRARRHARAAGRAHRAGAARRQPGDRHRWLARRGGDRAARRRARCRLRGAVGARPAGGGHPRGAGRSSDTGVPRARAPARRGADRDLPHRRRLQLLRLLRARHDGLVRADHVRGQAAAAACGAGVHRGEPAGVVHLPALGRGHLPRHRHARDARRGRADARPSTPTRRSSSRRASS